MSATTLLCLAGGQAAATFVVVTETADSTPLIAGIAAALVSGLMIPVVRWMMNRQDALTAAQQAAAAAAAKEASDAAARREDREDKRAEAFNQAVVALGSINTELRLLNENHKALDANRKQAVDEILERIDGLPDKIVKKCNGGT